VDSLAALRVVVVVGKDLLVDSDGRCLLPDVPPKYFRMSCNGIESNKKERKRTRKRIKKNKKKFVNFLFFIDHNYFPSFLRPPAFADFRFVRSALTRVVSRCFSRCLFLLGLFVAAFHVCRLHCRTRRSYHGSFVPSGTTIKSWLVAEAFGCLLQLNSRSIEHVRSTIS
jgi:hypothetical protein